MSRNLFITTISETPVHLGIGQSDGAIDLPIAREGHTDIPFVPASGLKGALRERFHDENDPSWKRIFGTGGDGNTAGEGAGTVLFGEMRLLLLPVRSLSGMYRWATCPLLLERFLRDRKRVLGKEPPFAIPTVSDKVLCAGGSVMFLEERRFEVQNLPEQLVGGLAMSTGLAEATLRDRLAVLPNDDFGWFCRHAVPHVARNQLEGETKISKNLWYEEFLPSDTVMTFALVSRMQSQADDVQTLGVEMRKAGYFRVGGNETVGHGWFRLLQSGTGDSDGE